MKQIISVEVESPVVLIDQLIAQGLGEKVLGCVYNKQVSIMMPYRRHELEGYAFYDLNRADCSTATAGSTVDFLKRIKDHCIDSPEMKFYLFDSIMEAAEVQIDLNS